MAENNELNLENIYGDTDYFINAIVSDYGFYGDFINAVRAGGTEIEVKRKHLQKTIENNWLDVIESALPALDIVVRKPSKELIDREEVLPIELSRNISSRSIRHLSQHTDYINSYENGNIIPSKILNVFRDETMITYENKFINTLVRRLYEFIEKRYSQIKKDGFNTTNIAMSFTSDFNVGITRGKIHTFMEVTDDSAEKTEDSTDNFQRLERLHSIALQYMETEFIRSMGQNYIRPPVIRTNAITKNKDLRQCLMLWEFVESYDKIGYTVDVSENAEKPDDDYIRNLYSVVALEYLMFKYNFEYDFKNRAKVIAQQSSKKPIAPKIVTKFKDIDTDNYDLQTTEYRRIVTVSSGNDRRKLSQDELLIRGAIDTALTAEKVLSGKTSIRKRTRKPKNDNK